VVAGRSGFDIAVSTEGHRNHIGAGLALGSTPTAARLTFRLKRERKRFEGNAVCSQLPEMEKRVK